MLILLSQMVKVDIKGISIGIAPVEMEDMRNSKMESLVKMGKSSSPIVLFKITYFSACPLVHHLTGSASS